jgi:hypothetical protein
MVFDIFLELSPSFDSDLEKYIIKEFRKKLKKRTRIISQRIQEPLQQIVRESIISTPEYRSLHGGRLQGELGVTSAALRIESVINTWVSNIFVEAKVDISPLLLIQIGFLEQGYADVLALPEASYDYERGTIPWLQWLLLEGDKRIVRSYEFAPITKYSRTGLGIMVPSGKRGWQVPSEFSGTETNNFATRAFDGVDTKIEKIVESVIRASI